MGLILDSGATETLDLSGNGTITSELNLTLGAPAILNELFDGNFPDDALEATFGASWTRGGPVGLDIGFVYTPDTQQTTLNVSVSGYGLGGSFAIEGTFDPDRGLFLINDVNAIEAFYGVNIIVGDQLQLLGFTIGNTANLQAGAFFDWQEGQSLSAHPGIRLSASSGLIIGSIEGVLHYDLLPFIYSANDLTLESATELFDALYQSPLESMGSVEEWIIRFVMPIVNILDALDRKQALDIFLERAGIDSCFGPEVPLDMWPLDPDLKPGPNGIYDQDEVRAQVWKKPIEQIRVGDLVVSFDDDGNLVPGPVTRTFQNDAKILLDFHGTRVTPGHVYYRPDSKKSYKYETLIDILRDDGVIEHQDGTPIRAATNVPIDSSRDGYVQAFTQIRKPDGTTVQNDAGRIRLGTRFLVGVCKQRKSFAIADLIEHAGGVVGGDELIRIDGGDPMPFLWEFSETLPKPEDFVLACSGTTLEDIYKASEWESQGPRLPAPTILDRGPVQPLKGVSRSVMPRNEPLNVQHAPRDEQQRAAKQKQ